MGMTLWQNLCHQTEKMTQNALSDVQSLDDWTRLRAERHREFMEAISLDPLPERCDLAITEYGEFEGEGYKARRIGFQIMPDCWSSACVYYPDPLPQEQLPAVLYVCGHGSIGTWHYQAHPMMWARRGYACLIVDTVEQNDNPGEHHAFTIGYLERWAAMGYTSAGAEVWNAMRAVDVMEADNRIDTERLAVTGVSGGGACSFHTAVADERIKAVSTLCGISSPFDAIANWHVVGHCDCMYPFNIYKRDISEYAALIAPRPALFCFAGDDTLFHADETTALVERTKKVYRLYEQEAHCKLVTCPGRHGDHPEFDEATSRWFDQHIAGEQRPLVERGDRVLSEQVISVFNGTPPSPNYLHLLPEYLSKRGTVPLPRDKDEWDRIRRNAVAGLPPSLEQEEEESRPMTLSEEWDNESTRLRAYQGSIEGIDVWMRTTGGTQGSSLVLSVGAETEHCSHSLARVATCVDQNTTRCAGFMPRIAGIPPNPPGPEYTPPGSWLPSWNKVLFKTLLLTGTTPVAMTIRDLGVALDTLFEHEETKGREVYLYGRNDGAVAALYRGLLDERIAGVILEGIPASHAEGAPILGILRTLDMAHAVGLMAPRKVALINPGHLNWTWANRVYGRLECPERFIMAADTRQAVQKILA